MYASSDPTGIIIAMVVIGIVSLLVLYYVIRAAVTEGMKNHTRWQVANRDEIEAKYGKRRRPESPDGSIGT